MFLGEHYLLAKQEGTPYTEEAPAGANAIEAYDINIDPLVGNSQNRNRVARGFHGAGEEIQLEQWVNIRFKVAISNSGAAGTAPAYGVLLAACFMSETIVATTSVAYEPAVTNAPCTIYYDIGNGSSTTRHKIIGCGGSVSMVEQNGQVGYLEFNLTGYYTRPGEASEITPDLTSFNEGLVFDDDNIDTFTLGGYAAKVVNLSVNFGPQIAPHNIKGNKKIDFAGRDVRGSMTVLAEELDTKNYFQLAESLNGATTGALSLVKGATAGSIETLAASKVQAHNIRQSSIDGLLAYDMDLIFIPSSGDDEFSWTLT
jgi:hypothetical protein